jgi:hypothetical protein
LPVLVVVPTVRRENELHSANSCSCRSPDLACWRLSRRRLALAGLVVPARTPGRESREHEAIFTALYSWVSLQPGGDANLS